MDNGHFGHLIVSTFCTIKKKRTITDEQIERKSAYNLD